MTIQRGIMNKIHYIYILSCFALSLVVTSAESKSENELIWKSDSVYFQEKNEYFKILYYSVNVKAIQATYRIGKPVATVINKFDSVSIDAAKGLGKGGPKGAMASVVVNLGIDAALRMLDEFTKSPQSVSYSIAEGAMAEGIVSLNQNYEFYKRIKKDGLSSLTAQEIKLFRINQVKVDMLGEAKVLYNTSKKDKSNFISNQQAFDSASALEDLLINSKHLSKSVLIVKVVNIIDRSNLPINQYQPFVKYTNTLQKISLQNFNLVPKNNTIARFDKTLLLPYKNKNGKYGYINEKGDWIIEPRFNSAGYFTKKGFAVVDISTKKGMINTKGVFIIKPNHEFIKINDDSDIALVMNGRNHTYYSKHGKKISNHNYLYAREFKHGHAIASLDDSKYGLLNSKGEWALKPHFDSIDSEYVLDFIPVANYSGRSPQYGIVNIEGAWLKEFDKTLVTEMTPSGNAKIFKNGKCGYVNKNFRLLTNIKYESCSDFEMNNIAIVETNRGIYGAINSQGKMIVKPRFEHISNEGKWGLVNAQNDSIVLELKYEHINVFHNGLAVVRLANGKSGYINEQGNWAIKPTFETAWYFHSNGLAEVKVNSKQGVINKEGVFVVKPTFDRVRVMDEFIETHSNKKVEYFDLNGNLISVN